MLGVTISNYGNIVTLCLRGKIVIGHAGILLKVVEAQTKSCIVLDLARVTAIDAHGLGVLLELRQYAESSGIEFRLMNVTRLVSRVLEITRLNSVFNIATPPLLLPVLRHPVATDRRDPCWNVASATCNRAAPVRT